MGGEKSYKDIEWSGEIKKTNTTGEYNLNGSISKSGKTKLFNKNITCDDIDYTNKDKIKAFCKINKNGVYGLESEYEWKKNNSNDPLSWIDDGNSVSHFKSDLVYVRITKENKKKLEEEIKNKMNIIGQNKNIYKVSEEDVIKYFLKLKNINKIIDNGELSNMIFNYLYENIMDNIGKINKEIIIKNLINSRVAMFLKKLKDTNFNKLNQDDIIEIIEKHFTKLVNIYEIINKKKLEEEINKYIEAEYNNIIINSFLNNSDKMYHKYLMEYFKNMDKYDISIFLYNFDNSTSFKECLDKILKELTNNINKLYKIQYLTDIPTEQVYIDDYNNNLIKIITSIININDIYGFKTGKKQWDVVLKLNIILYVIVEFPKILNNFKITSDNIPNLFPTNSDGEIIMFPEEIVNHFYTEFNNKKKNKNDTTEPEINSYLNNSKKKEIINYINNFNNLFIYKKINLTNSSSSYDFYIFLVRHILKGMARHDILIFIDKFKQPGVCNINMCFKKLIDHLKKNKIQISKYGNDQNTYYVEQYIKLNFLYDMCDDKYDNINEKITNKNFSKLSIKEITEELRKNSKYKDSIDPAPDNCPSKNIYTEQTANTKHYYAQSTISHPDKNKSCVPQSSEKFKLVLKAPKPPLI